MHPSVFHTRDVRLGGPLREGRLGQARPAEGPGGERLVLTRLAGLSPAAEEAEEMARRMAGVPACVAPVAIEARGGDLLVLYPFVDGVGPIEAAAGGSAVGAVLERAVAELHAAGLVHGALRDENVRVTATGEVRLLQVGLAGLGALGAVRVPTAATDRRDLRALLEQMEVARRGNGSDRADPTLRRRAGRRNGLGSPRRASAAGLVSLVVVALAAFGVAHADRRGAIVSAPISRVAVDPAPSHPSPCASGSLPGSGAATYYAVDMSGTGCAQPVAWAAGVIVTVSADGTPMRFSLGRPGDVLLVGRWFCSPAELPALYRPETGEVFYIRAWPLEGRAVTSDPAVETGVRDGIAHSSERDGCQHVEVAR